MNKIFKLIIQAIVLFIVFF